MRLDVLSIFPDYLAPLELSLIGRAREKGLLDLTVHDLRDWTHDRHRTDGRHGAIWHRAPRPSSGVRREPRSVRRTPPAVTTCGARSSWLALIGFAAVMFNFSVVNVFFKGLHSYSGL